MLDAWGFDKFLAAVEEKLGTPLQRVPAEAVEPRPPFDRLAHIGVHPQKQDGLHWIGVVLPVGKLTPAQMRGIAKIARELGDGDIRLTVWQNLLISGVPTTRSRSSTAAIAALGLATRRPRCAPGSSPAPATPAAASPPPTPRRHAEAIAAWCEARVALDTPVNIHLTGCHHSCAQHYIGDIGLIGARVADQRRRRHRRRLHILVGGGYRARGRYRRASCSRRQGRGCAAHRRAHAQGYLAHRASTDETFLAFATPSSRSKRFRACRKAGGGGMNADVSAGPELDLIPETAPFSAEQRAWLNGFFAGLVSLDTAGVTPLSPEQARP